MSFDIEYHVVTCSLYFDHFWISVMVYVFYKKKKIVGKK